MLATFCAHSANTVKLAQSEPSHDWVKHMNKKIAVLGCGAIGSSVSADLTAAGYDVTVIDQ